jgi:hypothetical protein
MRILMALCVRAVDVGGRYLHRRAGTVLSLCHVTGLMAYSVDVAVGPTRSRGYRKWLASSPSDRPADVDGRAGGVDEGANVLRLPRIDMAFSGEHLIWRQPDAADARSVDAVFGRCCWDRIPCPGADPVWAWLSVGGGSWLEWVVARLQNCLQRQNQAAEAKPVQHRHRQRPATQASAPAGESAPEPEREHTGDDDHLN